MAEPMRIRVAMAGDVADVKVLMNHPMETGLRKDAKTGQLIPGHFITEVIATVNGTPVLAAEMSGGISKNPYLGFKIKGPKAGDKVSVSWADNKGDKSSVEATIG